MKQVLENPAKNQTITQGGFNYLVIFSSLLVTLYLTSNLMATKILEIFGITLFDAGTITFPFAYMLGDVITEIWGFKTSRKIIFLSFACNIIMIICTGVGVFLPYPESNTEIAGAYATVFGYLPRIVIGSLCAFLSGELTNAWLMDKIKKWTNGKRLWVRTIGSSVAAHLIDTTVFTLVAFSGEAKPHELFEMIIFLYIAKVLIEALAGTPLAYGLIAFIKRREARSQG